MTAGSISKLAKIYQSEIDCEIREGATHLGKTCQLGLGVEDSDEWKAWWADLYYYSANNHPLHGIFACDSNNRLERLDRVMMEVATLAYCLWMAFEREEIQNGKEHELPAFFQQPRTFSTCCVTIPSMIIFYVLFFLFTTPKCGMADESTATEAEVNRAKMISHIGDMVGNLCVFSLILIALCRVWIFNDGDNLNFHVAWTVFMSRGFSYLLGWFLMVSIYFNPVIAWGASKPGTTSVGDYIGLGQWTVEKNRLQLSCAELPESAHNDMDEITSLKNRSCMSSPFSCLSRPDSERRQLLDVSSEPTDASATARSMEME
jgi:hypothetical protein